jgi:hypothetical protein
MSLRPSLIAVDTIYSRLSQCKLPTPPSSASINNGSSSMTRNPPVISTVTCKTVRIFRSCKSRIKHVNSNVITCRIDKNVHLYTCQLCRAIPQMNEQC